MALGSRLTCVEDEVMAKVLGNVVFLAVLLAIVIFLFAKKERRRWRVFLQISCLVLILTVARDIGNEDVSINDYVRPLIAVLIVALMYLIYREWSTGKDSTKVPLSADRNVQSQETE